MNVNEPNKLKKICFQRKIQTKTKVSKITLSFNETASKRMSAQDLYIISDSKLFFNEDINKKIDKTTAIFRIAQIFINYF